MLSPDVIELNGGNSHENSGPVVMEMASARTKIHHFFGFTFYPRAGSPVIL